MLQIVISTPEFSNGVNFTDQIILENADDITLIKSVAIADESISFSLPQADPKASEVNFLRWWECWDTVTNERKNYGPIDTIERPTGGSLKISGPGRSAILRDVYKTIQTFHYPIDQFIDDLRYENVASEPRTQVLINTDTDSEYYGLSKRNKETIIDDNVGYISPGRDTPNLGIIRADQFWAGTGRADWITVDLGESYTISRARVLLPWWGSTTVNWNRSFDWTWNYSENNASFSTLFDTEVPDHRSFGFMTRPGPTGIGYSIFSGETPVQTATSSVVADSNPVDGRYWKLDISQTYAYYSVNDGNTFTDWRIDEWDWECDGSNEYHNSHGEPIYKKSPGVLTSEKILPQNDCYASVVEIEIDKKILGRDNIPLLYYQQINNNNRQITYLHRPEASETVTVGSSRKFEPGTFFRRVVLNWSDGSPDTYDEFNHLLSEGSGYITTPANSSFITIKNSSDVVVTEVDTWQGKLDPLSFNANYSYSTVVDDTATLHFRGVSVKWYITVPSDVTAGEVSIELREWYAGGGEYWGDWITLENSLTLPTGVSAYKVWEIEYESGILKDDTVYELRITNLNGGYVSVDAFAGFWSGSFSDLNENDPRFYQRWPNAIVQEYGDHFSFGSIYKYPLKGVGITVAALQFYGDRVILYGAKGPNLGTIKLGLDSYDIPDGDVDGYLTVNLDSPYWLYQAIIFDSNDYFENLPWQWHSMRIYQREDSTGPLYFDGMGIHASTGLSLKFANPTSHLDILKATIEALGMEGEINEDGINIVPRLGRNTDIIMREGSNILISFNNTEDITKVATMLQITGADIDGLPLSAVVEDKNTKREFGRTIQRDYSLNNVSDYFTLIGAGRTELIKRKQPERRLNVTYSGPEIIFPGDSFIAKKRDAEYKVRAMSTTRTQGKSGTTHTVECVIWPIYNESFRYDQALPTQTIFMQPALTSVSIYNPWHWAQAQAQIEGPVKVQYAQAQVDISPTYSPEGFGKNALSGTARSDYHVTTLSNGTGTGTLRDALTSSNRNIIFDVSGEIALSSTEIQMTELSNIVIDGATSAGGITISGRGLRYDGCHHMVLRNIAFRDCSDPWLAPIEIRYHNVGGTDIYDAGTDVPSHDIMVDHCSISGYSWRGLTVGGGCYNVTIQNTFIGPYYDWGNPSYNYQTYVAALSSRVSFNHCLFYNGGYRCPGFGYDMYETSTEPTEVTGDIANCIMWSDLDAFSDPDNVNGYYSLLNVNVRSWVNVRNSYFHSVSNTTANHAIHTENGGDVYQNGCYGDGVSLSTTNSVGSAFTVESGYGLTLDSTASTAGSITLSTAGRYPRDSVDSDFASAIYIY